jgi:hypothetical protein
MPKESALTILLPTIFVAHVPASAMRQEVGDTHVEIRAGAEIGFMVSGRLNRSLLLHAKGAMICANR